MKPRPQAARNAVAVIALGLIAVVSGCVAPPPTLPAPISSPEASEPASLSPAGGLEAMSSSAEVVWSTPSEGATGSPVVVAGMVVTYEIGAEQQLSLSGFDLASGARQWTLPAGTHDIFRGQLQPSVVEDASGAPRIVSISPSYERETPEYFFVANDVRVIDPVSGAVVASRDGGWASELIGCGLDGMLCFWDWNAEAETSTRMVVDGDGQFREHGEALGYAADIADWRSVTESTIVVTDAEGSESLARYVDGVQTWTTPVEALGFPELADSWIQAHEVDDAGLAVIQSNGAFAGGDGYTIPAGAFSVAVVDLETGETVARYESAIICAQTSLCLGDVSLDVSYDATGAEQTDWTFEDVTLTAFDDLRTGDERWSASYRVLRHLPGVDPDDARLGWDSFIFIDTGDAQELLDWESGERFSVAPGDAFGCYQPRTVTSRDADIWGDPSTYWIDAIGAGCDESGVVVEDPAAFTPAIVGGAGGWTWLSTSETDALSDDDLYGHIEFVPVHTGESLVLFRR